MRQNITIRTEKIQRKFTLLILCPNTKSVFTMIVYTRYFYRTMDTTSVIISTQRIWKTKQIRIQRNVIKPIIFIDITTILITILYIVCKKFPSAFDRRLTWNQQYPWKKHDAFTKFILNAVFISVHFLFIETILIRKRDKETIITSVFTILNTEESNLYERI